VLAAAFFVSNFATAALSTHLIPYLVGRRYSATTAAKTIGWMGAMQLSGRLLFVPIAARLGARVMVAAVFVAQALGMGQLPLLGLIGTLLPFIFLQGAANGLATLARGRRRSRGSSAPGTTARSHSAPMAPGRSGPSVPRSCGQLRLLSGGVLAAGFVLGGGGCGTPGLWSEAIQSRVTVRHWTK
jgi:hypothetical protein